MKLGNVTAIVEAKKMAPGLENQRLLAVEADGGTVVALDKVGATPGDRVVILTGSGSDRMCMEMPADAVIVAVVG